MWGPIINRRAVSLARTTTINNNKNASLAMNINMTQMRFKIDVALNHFDGLYSKIYGDQWPSARLGLLSPKKQCAIFNTYLDHDQSLVESIEGSGAIDLQRYYKKHLHHYIRVKAKEQLLQNKRIRKRELMANQANVGVDEINPSDVEVSDISDSEIAGANSTDDEGGLSSAEDLHAMFSDRRMDDEDKFFFNKARVDLSLDDFVPATEMIYREDVPNDLEYYDNYSGLDPDLIIDQVVEPSLSLDDQLRIYTFPRCSWSTFNPPSQISPCNLYNYYLLDGASILAVLALGVQLNDKCGDYCVSPGGKSLAIMMTLKPKYLLANDKSKSRLARFQHVTAQYLPKVKYVKSTLELSNYDAKSLVYPDLFDKILVDVPCSNDRHNISVSDNNLFSVKRTKERIDIPKIQSKILIAALKSVKPGGTVVYSTCTMSPVENDGTVQFAIQSLMDRSRSTKYAIVDLKEAFRPLRGLFKFSDKCKYGQQVVPNITSNFGPMYICKIKRTS